MLRGECLHWVACRLAAKGRKQRPAPANASLRRLECCWPRVASVLDYIRLLRASKFRTRLPSVFRWVTKPENLPLFPLAEMTRGLACSSDRAGPTLGLCLGLTKTRTCGIKNTVGSGQWKSAGSWPAYSAVSPPQRNRSSRGAIGQQLTFGFERRSRPNLPDLAVTTYIRPVSALGSP